MSSSCKPLFRIIPLLVRRFRQIKFGDKKIEESGVRDILCFQGACEEKGTQNLKRIKQILRELYFLQLRLLRQVT